MNEQNQEFDPRDVNQDGNVSIEEKIRAAADMAEEAFGKAAGAVKDGVEQVVGKVKDYRALSPEEKKAKEDVWNSKATAFAEKASNKAKELAEEVKEGAGRFFRKKES
ncbi:MAG: hypothetical protein J5737_04545 [Bacteroidales bacterium]|nr:hypothetical protein [Bacteroidales bacterium]